MPEITSEQKKIVEGRAHECCEYCHCQLKFSPDPFSIEHIYPRSKGGTSDLENLAFACQGCNNRKYNSVTAIDPITGATVPLYHPRQMQWADHFAWNEDFTILLGITPTGRATTDKLLLNRPGVVNLRRVLRTTGDHPPVLS